MNQQDDRSLTQKPHVISAGAIHGFFLYNSSLYPPFQIVLLLVLSTVALLFGRAKLALLINYLFTLYWGYLFNKEHLLGTGFENADYYTVVYFGIGLITVVLALIGFLYSE